MTGHPWKPPPHAEKPKPSDKKREKAKEHLDELLDEALEETFPASDPAAMIEPAPASPPPARKQDK
jgi:hypothetical protein